MVSWARPQWETHQLTTVKIASIDICGQNGTFHHICNKELGHVTLEFELW
ncbi:hypothetical protein Lalb_Chr25g0281121 [Lupinus albus]|uniref:Uncharacterized protein n=1 Tax=Lupinus albus TaxID=3870 RepID=A0A6A4NDI5_LUPAL|nr:hypothetical protein Lalb_Chr25g0281121 [Lupinus albus]